MTVISLLLFIVALVVALYIPFVQDFIVPRVLTLVSSEDMSIKLDHFRLSFPLDVNIKGLEITQKGDTMLMAGDVDLSVKPLPLISGEIKANRIDLSEVYFKSGAPDSASYVRAQVGNVTLNDADVRLGKQLVDFDNVELSGGNIKIALRTDTTVSPPSAPSYWQIHGNKITLADIDYEMTMVDTGDSIAARLDRFTLAEGRIDMGAHTVNIGDVALDGIDARYIVGNGVAPVVPADTVATDTVPWTIQVNHLLLDKGKVLYAAAGAKPQPGLDMEYIGVSHVTVEVDSFYNQGAVMKVPLKKLVAVERSGLKLYGDGVFAMTEKGIDARNFHLRTMASELNLNADYGLTGEDAPISVALSGAVDPVDLLTAFPSLGETLEMLPKYRKINLKVDASGTMSDLKIAGISVYMRNYFDVKLKGSVRGIDDMNHASGHLDIDGGFEDVNFLKPTLMGARAARSTQLPPLSLIGGIDLKDGVIGGDIKALTHDGKLALDGKWNSRAEGYDIDFTADNFPVGTFLPGSGIGKVTMAIDAHGCGFDPMVKSTRIYAAVDAIKVDYRGQSIHDLKILANLDDGNAELDVTSANRVIDGNLHVAGNLTGKTYDWRMAGDFKNIDLYALGLTDTVSTVSASLAGNIVMTPSIHTIDAGLEVHRLNAILGATVVNVKDFNLDFAGTDSTSVAYIDNQDLKVKFESPMLIDSVASRFSSAMELITPMLDSHDVKVGELQRRLPPFALSVDAGNRNALHDFLAADGTSFRRLSLRASNDSLIRVTASVDTLVTGETRLDRIAFNAVQEDDRLNYELNVDNEPGTFDDFAHIAGKGYIGGDKVMMSLWQRNIKDQTGYNIGALVELSDSILTLRIEPANPVIGYKQWTVNDNNFITLNTRTLHLDANMMISNADSHLRIFTNHDSEAAADHQETINVDIENIQIADWISLSPYAPPMKGDLSANLKFALAPNTVNGSGTVTLADFMYDKKRVGTLGLDLDVTTSRSGAITAVTALNIDGARVMSANGALNDTTLVHPFQLDFDLTRLPLRIANPFLGPTIGLDGYLSGKMDITGRLSEPLFNGYLDFDSATAKIGMLGTSFRFSEDNIPVDSNVIRFNKYAIYGVNENPLEIDGTFDMRSLSDMRLDLSLHADNMQVVGNDKRRGADVYGKAFISLEAMAQGNMDFINARANLSVNEGTNVTYVIPDAGSQISQQSTGDMVHFVNFNDSTVVSKIDSVTPAGTAINLTAILNVEPGTTIGVDLSANGQDRVQLNSNGMLDFTLNPMGDTRTTGRLNLTGGYVRYSPPLMSEKMFDFQEGSYVAFNGNMDNPILHVTAIDVIKANVTQEGQNSRLVNFDVILRVNGTLEEMDVAFDLDTDEDLTVRNELQSMSPEQRANQAMNLLLYNIYTGPGTKGNANITGNPLYSFLSSTLNTWMANNVKGVDITFGIDQYERTLDGAQSTTTSYSYRVSKSFLDNRFKVVVGGNYSTDADPNENLAQNLINDISIEYLLNKSGSMYVRLFRHTGYESILEGEVTQTGVGFVYKRKLRTLRNLFNLHRRQPNTLPQEGAVRTAGDVLRRLMSKRPVDAPAATVTSGRQPFKNNEDEKTAD